ncbi:helix-turn-helix domain-containing protein [Ureibacillus chungkukjangi]|uniref:helix-turn-helix domain-containing protein n=1 Tax=Ureibacillus chungkukjangi TaxID=1202712 RepID=UPI00203D92A4|nr:helix-turn-helix transcriptional regulator [Ureibacillus chungkukjangi]MCM3390615.1 helix-turn-helix domain-containing protein [Ureibacillus chungkukjangi]
MNENENEFIFGRLVKRSRTEQNLTLQELSNKTNGEITASYINRLESGNKSKPGFDVVCELCNALSLDIREVLQSFGYESLIKEYDQDAIYSLEEFIRLHKVKLPGSIEQIKEADRLINPEEQELLIELINTVFDYSFVNESQAVEKLSSIIKQLYILREKEQKYLLNTNTFEFHTAGITYTVECDLKKLDVSDFNAWKNDMITVVSQLGDFFEDNLKGILNLTIDNEAWIVEKKDNHLKFICRKTDIVSLK